MVGIKIKKERDSKGNVWTARDVSSDVRNPEPNPASSPRGYTFATMESSSYPFERNLPEFAENACGYYIATRRSTTFTF